MRSRPIPPATATDKANLLANLRAAKEFCSTKEAADVLGVAPGTVQKMVRLQQLDAWVTGGGHRRIRVDSIANVLNQISQARPTATLKPIGSVELKVLAVCGDDQVRGELAEQIASWGGPIRLVAVSSAVPATIKMCKETPQMVLLYTSSSGDSDLRFVDQWIEAGIANDTDFVVVAPEGSHAAQADWVTAAFRGALPYSELRAFCQARLAQMIRDRRKQLSTAN